MGPLSTKYNVNGSTASDSQNWTTESGPDSPSSTNGPKPNKDNNAIDFSNDETRIYYAVHIPLDSQVPSEIVDITSTIFEDKQEALKLVKKYKRARFKAFDSLTEAKLFTVNGAGSGTSLTPSRSVVGQPSSTASIEGSVSNIEPLSLTVGEKPSPFKGPKSQDLVRFRKAIESGDVQFIQKTVWENPRYLVSSGDTPSILQEGSRYNALHVCAKSNKAVICSFILKTISNVDFIKRLYGDNSESIEAAEDRCKVLLDLYLNTPDKGFNETPLHFSVKHGSIDVVRVLVSYAQCDKTALNKFKQAPKDIICSRVSASGDNGDLYKKIIVLLEEQYFIPVLRSQDPSIQPTIGQPFSPSKPLHLSGDIKSPAMEVQGVAGPMPLDTARMFRRRWKTPPRDPTNLISPVLKTMLQDPDKGLEKVGRDLAEENNVCWMEFWAFLNTFANFRTEEGRDLLENYLMKRFKQGVDKEMKSSLASDTPAFKSPVSELCDAFRSWRLSGGGEQISLSESCVRAPESTCIQSRDKPNHATEQYNGIVQSDDVSVAVSPHLYIEKSCQVFTKRIADGLLRFPDAPGEPIACEMIYLNMLVTSCLNDSRFASVNFARLHSRIATCLTKKFSSDDRDILLNAVDVILKKKYDIEGSSSEEETIPFREREIYRRRISRCQKASIYASVQCIAQHISNSLSLVESTDYLISNPPSTEEDCVRLWQAATTCDCVWSPHHFKTRQSLRRNNYPSTARKIDFSPVSKGERRSINYADNTCIVDKKVEGFEESAGEESDTSDTDCGEFFTPPSSPRDRNTPVSSEDDFAMESPDEGPDVYIDGDVPTSLDNAVLDALGKVDINPAVYPNICRWKLLVTMHSSQQRERWPSPRRSMLSHRGSCSRMPTSPL